MTPMVIGFFRGFLWEVCVGVQGMPSSYAPAMAGGSDRNIQ